MTPARPASPRRSLFRLAPATLLLASLAAACSSTVGNDLAAPLDLAPPPDLAPPLDLGWPAGCGTSGPCDPVGLYCPDSEVDYRCECDHQFHVAAGHYNACLCCAPGGCGELLGPCTQPVTGWCPADGGVSCTAPDLAVDACDNTCAGGFLCCNGVCANPAADIHNCGACGNTCTVVHGTPKCAGRVCAIAACDPGFADCNGSYSDGCETPINGSGTGNCP